MSAAIKRKALVGIFGFLSVVSLFSAVAATTTLAYYHRVLPNTVVAGVKIGNTEPTEAIKSLQVKASQLQTEPISISLNDKSITTNLGELGFTLVPEQTTALSTASQDLLLWLKPRYWQSFFVPKTYAFSYQFDSSKFQSTLSQKLGVQNTALNATITVENGALTVKPSATGIALDYDQIKTTLDDEIGRGTIAPIAANFTETKPDIPTEVATSTKTTIESSLKPVYLQSDTQKFTLSLADLYATVDYKASPNTLEWVISKEKLSALLTDKVTKRLNVKMIPKTVMSDTGAVTNQGRDGKEVDATALVDDVYRTITEKTDTIVAVNIKTIPLVEKIIYPDYVPNLFPGLYVDISLAKQTMYIMNGATPTAQFLISSGKRGTPSPNGLLYVCNKIELARSPLYVSLYMRKWNALSTSPDSCSGYKGYGVHDLPCWDAACTVFEGESHLGKPVSHGCIRLGHDNAAWFYDNIPVGTPVNIH